MELLIPSEPGRKNNLNTIRLAMALLVVWSHSFALYYGSERREWVSLLLNGTYNAGNIGVMAFFAISGYLITKSFVSSRSASSYMLKRIKRIYPGFLVAIIVCAIVVVPAYSTIMKADGQEAVRVFTHALILKAYWPISDVFAGNARPGAVNGSLWSISYEFWCYLGVLALGVIGLVTNRRLLLVLLFAFLLARVGLDLLDWKPRIGQAEIVIGSVYVWTEILPSFLAGMVIYAFADRIPRSRVILAAFALGAVASAHISPYLASLTVTPALAYIIFYIGFSETRLPDAAAKGDFSYGTYLYAFPIQQMLVASFGDRLSFAAYFIAAAVLSVIAGAASHYMVERWFEDKRKRPMDAALAAE